MAGTLASQAIAKDTRGFTGVINPINASSVTNILLFLEISRVIAKQYMLDSEILNANIVVDVSFTLGL